jgi:monoamine oxidase
VGLATCASPSDHTALDLFQQLRTVGSLARFSTAEQRFFPSGAQAIATRMAAGLDDRIRLSTPVRRIEHGGHGVRVVCDTEQWNARYVIVAVPLAVVQDIAFDPPLPRARIEMQGRVVRGSVLKSVLVFDRAPWRDTGASGFSVSDSGPVNVVVDGSDAAGRPGVLVALSVGSHATELSSRSAVEREAIVLAHVRRQFPSVDRAALLGHLDCDWSSERWSGGGYAARLGPGAWTRFGAALCEPVGPIHWAGTETAREWRSYMEGALESAERSVRELRW